MTDSKFQIQPVEPPTNLFCWFHPEIAAHDTIDENSERYTDEQWKQLKKNLGVAIDIEHMDYADAPAMTDSDWDNCDWSNIKPEPPTADHFLIAAFDTEDGPCLWWAKATERRRMKKVVLRNAGMHKSDWVIVYLDPNSSFSAGGGRITVITEDQCGSYFFGHVGQPSFEEFIANTRPSYLMGKLFHEIKEDILAEDGQDIIDWIAKNGISELKEARQSKSVSKKQLRELYEELKEVGFESLYHLSDVIEEDCLKTLFDIYGEDCLWNNVFKKKNLSYEFMSSIINSVIIEFKKELCSEAQGEGHGHIE